MDNRGSRSGIPDPQVPEVQAPPRPPQHDKYPWPEKPRLLGTRVSRIDGPLKVIGPREVLVRHRAAGHDLRPHPAIAARARAAEEHRRGGGGEGAGREGVAHHDQAGRQGDVSRRRDRRARRDDRAAGGRRAAHDQGRVGSAAGAGQRRAGDAAGSAAGVHAREHAQGHGAGRRRSRRRIQGGRVHRRRHLLDAGADAHLARDARLRVRVERRQPDGVGVDAGGARHARRLRAGAEDPAGQRARDHRVHGRRLRQQVRPRHAGPAVRAACEGRQRAGEADARSQGRAPRHRQSAVGVRESEGRRLRRRQAHRVRRDRRGARAARARDPITRCRTSTCSRIAGACTPTSTSTRDSSARCARPDIRKGASSPKC